jgi:hypothetical protein
VRLPNRGWTEIITDPATDDQRMPTQFLWDLGIGKHFNIGKSMALNIDLQILNLLNDDSPEYWRDTNYPADQEPIPGEWVLPRRAYLRLRLTF